MNKDLNEAPLSTLIAIKGIKSSDNLIEFLGALMADVTSGTVEPENALTCLSISDKIVEVARFALQEPRSNKALGSGRELTRPARDDF